MFIEMPVSCMSVSAAKIDSGMLTAATSVERRLNRNRKIVRIAKSAPRPPSRTSPSRDSLMKPDRSETVRIRMSGFRAWAAVSSAWTASATVTVFAPDVFETLIVTAGWPSVRA